MRLRTPLQVVILISLSPYNYSQSKAPAPEAIEALRARAEKGDVDAQNNLGEMYGKGQGVPQDYAEAVKWYRKAADRDMLAPSSTSASATSPSMA